MDRTKIMINGLPGKVAALVAENALNDSRFELLPYALTGPEIAQATHQIGDTVFQLIRPDQREDLILRLLAEHGFFISVDYTHPAAVNTNAEFYCSQGLPFVMGTTGGDREQLDRTVQNSSTAAVIAPNMAKQIVGFQAMMAYMADNFPNLFKGYHLTIQESHQASKVDTSGTAKAMVKYFNALGIKFRADQIEQERDPLRQRDQWGVPKAYLDGHGWHTYTLVSFDKSVKFEFSHNVNGRQIYVKGTLDAVVFLKNQIQQGAKGRVFTMIDVLKAVSP